MRRFPLLLAGALLGLGVSSAHAQQAPAPPSGPRAAPAPAPPAPEPPAAEPYDPAKHGGMPYGAYLLATRGTARRSTGMMITGIVLTGVSAVVMGVGTGVYASGGSCTFVATPTPDGGFGDAICQNTTQHATGMAILVAGTIGVGLGIPLWVAGASDVRRAEAARALPTVVVGSNGGALRWEF
jgi:hypothetical protein